MLQKNNQILLLHPGTQYSHQLAKQLYRKDILFKFCSGFILSDNWFFRKVINTIFEPYFKKISNRIIRGLPSNKLVSFPVQELISLNKIKRSNNAEQSYFKRNLQFQELIKNSIIKKSSAVIGFDTSSWIIINKCRNLSIPFILDVSIAHSNSKNLIYEAIAKQYPTWTNTLELKSQKLLEIEQKELENSTHIVVASTFSKNSLIQNGIVDYKISMNPYGIDLSAFPLKPIFNKTNIIRFIFSGLVDARKGIPLLLDVFKQLNSNKAMLSIVGPIQANIEQLIRKNYELENIEIIGKVPHIEMPELIQRHDVFVFPSYFEGFALVILEAMASGLPVITTTATAGPDIIENGIEGFIIEPGDKEGLTAAIQFFIDNPSQIEIMGRAARKKAELYSWDAYGDRWEKIINAVTYLA